MSNCVILVIAALSCSLRKSTSDFSATFFLACFPFVALLPVKIKDLALMLRGVEEGAELVEEAMTLESGCERAWDKEVVGGDVLEKVTDVVEEEGG